MSCGASTRAFLCKSQQSNPDNCAFLPIIRFMDWFKVRLHFLFQFGEFSHVKSTQTGKLISHWSSKFAAWANRNLLGLKMTFLWAVLHTVLQYQHWAFLRTRKFANVTVLVFTYFLLPLFVMLFAWDQEGNSGSSIWPTKPDDGLVQVNLTPRDG